MAAKELPKLWGRSAWSFFQHYDPLAEWSSHPLKTLAVFAENDYQVTSKDMQAWRNLARTNSLLSISSMPGVGHVFTAVAGRPSPQSYLVKQAPSDELAKAIAAFMNEACDERGMGNSRQSLPSKGEVIATVIDIFIREIGFLERHEVSPTTNVVRDFRIDTDDLSLFAEAVDKHFGIHPPIKEWSSFEATLASALRPEPLRSSLERLYSGKCGPNSY